MSHDETNSSRHLKSVTRSFKIIEYLRENGPATLSKIAAEFDLPISTAHIHLSTLVKSDYVIKEDGLYRCSLLFLRTGGQLRDRKVLYQAAKSEIDDLQQQVSEIANVGILENGYMVQLYKSENPDSIDDSAPEGAHLYLHTTSTGKAILSQLSEDELDRIIEQRGLPGLTDDTITTKSELVAQLQEIRERGYSINRGEHYTGVFAIGTPILSDSEDLLGAISISGPLSRIERNRIEDELVPALFDKKNVIELKIRQIR